MEKCFITLFDSFEAVLNLWWRYVADHGVEDLGDEGKHAFLVDVEEVGEGVVFVVDNLIVALRRLFLRR